MLNISMNKKTSATGMSSYVAVAQSCTAPIAAAHATAVSFAGSSAAQAATSLTTAGVRTTDLPGSPPRGAPV